MKYDKGLATFFLTLMRSREISLPNACGDILPRVSLFYE